jgi:hypothetical protein
MKLLAFSFILAIIACQVCYTQVCVNQSMQIVDTPNPNSKIGMAVNVTN